jgi:AcrR family transcriptional regulator
MGITERRQRERQARRESVLRAARQLLLEKGFRGTTTKEIAECCELSEASLFFYFKNKDEILVSLLFESIDFWTQNLARIESLNLPAERRLDEIWKFHEEVWNEHPEYYVLSAYLAQPQILEGISAEIREEIARRSGENFQRLARLLGQSARDKRGQTLADSIWAMFLGLTILCAARNNLGHAETRTGPRDRARIFDTLKRGMLQIMQTENDPL